MAALRQFAKLYALQSISTCPIVTTCLANSDNDRENETQLEVWLHDMPRRIAVNRHVSRLYI